MSHKLDEYDIEITLQILKYATRQLVAELDLKQVVYHSIATMADFASSQNVSLFILNEDMSSATLLGTMVKGIQSEQTIQMPVKNTPFAEVIEKKTAAEYHCQVKKDYPIPTFNIFSKNRKCTCQPLIGTNNKVIGFINFEHQPGRKKYHEEIISVISTLIAAVIENARLFQLATIDGLTGLYVRRYFDIRLQEEITRLKRMDSDLSLILFDIDHFKAVNDTFGHQQGDIILRQLAEIIQAAIRKDIDIPCRYGGEELILILPGTDLQGAIVLGERIRKHCEDFSFESLSGKKINITVSGGIVSINSKTNISKEDFFASADKQLYKAKEQGRNRIRF